MLFKKLLPLYNAISRYIERANRTLQEEFAYYHLNPFIEDPVKFNSKLMEYLISHSTRRVYKGSGNLSPIDYVIFTYRVNYL